MTSHRTAPIPSVRAEIISIMHLKAWEPIIGCNSTARICSTRCRPATNSGEYMEEEGNKLGQPASHGCVRLTVADAEWFYNQIPEGTPVTIA